MSYDTITLARDGRGVSTLTLNRPDKHNALNAAMIADLANAAAELAADEATRVVVLTGAGNSFCAGGDLTWMQEQMAADAQTRAREARSIAEMLHALNTLPKPLIGKLQGNAFGGGVGMASVCDVAIGVETLKMCLSETRLGLIPATIGPYVIARLGEANARRVFMNGRVFDATEAVQLGALARSVPPGELDVAVEAEITPYLSCAPGAVASAKALTRALGPRIDRDIIDHTIDALVARWETDEAETGINAFFAKTLPPWRSKS